MKSELVAVPVQVTGFAPRRKKHGLVAARDDERRLELVDVAVARQVQARA